MISQSRRHPRCALLPSRVDQPGLDWFPFAQLYPQTLLRARKVVKGMKEDDAPAHLRPVFADAPTFSDERSEGMTQRQVESLNQTGTDRQAELCEAGGATLHALRQRLETAMALLLADLRVDQVRMRFDHRFAGASTLASACKLRDLVIDHHERGHGTTETIAEKTGDPGYHCRCHVDQGHGTVVGAWPNEGREHEPKLGRGADPYPLAAIGTLGQAFTIGRTLVGVLAFDEVPPLVELSLGDRQGPQQVSIDLGGLLGGPLAPDQHGLFRDPEHKADPGQIHTDQKHLEGHHDVVFCSAKVEKDRLAGLRQAGLTRVAAHDAALAAVGEIRGDSAHVPTLHSALMSTLGIRARWAPVSGCPHRSILR